MSSTRSPSPTGQATERGALIVAHGSPSETATLEAVVAALAARVSAQSGMPVRSVTLAAEGALEAALDSFAVSPVIYPLFMSDGYFVNRVLRGRLEAAGHGNAPMATPFGLDDGFPALCERRAREAAARAGLDPAETTLILAAHGSRSGPKPAQAARAVAAGIHGFKAVQCCFVEEQPDLETGLAVKGPAICLPLFATCAGHVVGDLPRAVRASGFAGPVLEPIGCSADTPMLIADALRRLQ